MPPRSNPLLRTILVLCGAAVAPLSAGCATLTQWMTGGWVADYDTAERLAGENGRDLLIYYHGPYRADPDRTERSLRDKAVASATRSYVKCILYKPHEPDRRYVGQFGVQRAPALIVVRADGTYHAREGLLSPDDVLGFLQEAQVPGAVIAFNRHIPRRIEYRWHRTLQAAHAEADRTGAPTLYVFERWFSGDGHNLDRLLEAPEVHARFAGMVHVRLSSWTAESRRLAELLGVQQWPALALDYPDGQARVLEVPTSAEQVVRFADGRTEPGLAHGTPPATATADELETASSE